MFFLLFLCSVPDDNNTKCSVDASGRRWTCSSGQSHFSCLVNDSGDGILCVEEQHCPFAEERGQIHITVHVKTKYFLVESYSKNFYLSEIGETSLGNAFVFFCTQHSVFFHLFMFLSLPFSVFISLCLLLSPSIVKPDKVSIRKVNTTTIEWSYPSSWSSPFSYFPLTFQIAQIKGACRRCDNPCTDSKASKVRGPDWL